MKVFVAGGSGFIGTNFVLLLRNMGIHVDYCSSKEIFFNDDNKQSVIMASLKDLDLKEYDSVIHCAAFTGGVDVIKKQPDRLISENTKITLDLLESCARSKVKHFIFISSSAVYPSSLESLVEEDGFKGDPDPAFFGPGWMKRYCEKLCVYYHQQYNMDVLVVRPSNVYGVYDYFKLDKAHVIPALINRFSQLESTTVAVYGMPSVLRDFIYVEDFVSLVVQLVQSQEIIGFNIINVSSGVSVTMETLVIYIQELTKTKKTYTFDISKPTTRKIQKISNVKLRNIIPFPFSFTPLVNGLNATIDYYNSLIRQLN